MKKIKLTQKERAEAYTQLRERASLMGFATVNHALDQVKCASSS